MGCPVSYRDELAAIGERADAETTRLQGEVARLQAIIDSQTPEEPEPIPVTVLQVVAGDGQATLTWTAVPGATGYLVGRDGTDTGGSGPWETVDAPAVSSRTFLHLRNGVNYTLHVEPQGVASPRKTITVTPKAATTPPVTPPTGRGWLSGAGTVEVGNINPGKYLGDYRGSALEIGQTWQNTPDVWGIDPGVANSWANWAGAMCISCSPATWKGWAAIAGGADDAFWTAYAKTVHQRRAGKGQTYMAPFYEFNGTWMPWSVTRTAQGMADFRNAWARVAGIIRANAPTVRIVMAPAQGRDLPDAMVPATTTFDLLGGTNYNAWPWSPNGDAAMQRLETYRLHAERLGKPVGITEWANSGNPSEQGGGGEAPGFIRAVHAWLTKNRGTGAGQVEFETFFNIPGYALDHLIVQTNGQPSTTQPLTAAAYRELW